MAGDGVFMWYWGPGSAPDRWRGGYAARKDAEEQARGHCPNGDYSIAEAERVAITASVFSASAVLRQVDEHSNNSACWPDTIPPASPREMEDLEAKLADCLDRWLRKNNYDTTTALFAIRTQEYVPDKRGMFAHV